MKQILSLAFIIGSFNAAAQNDRLKDRNTIAWSQFNLTLPLSKKTDILFEYQWRRAEGFSQWQQSLLRTAFQYKLSDHIAVAAGYGWIETFVYGDYPIAANGNFPEHRLYEQLTWKNVLGRLTVLQRLRIEQRWLGRRAPSPQREIEEWLFSHRFRHLIRVQHPFTATGKAYFAVADELFISAGKNVGVNIFDQNRLMLLVGTKLNDHISVEAGYLSQTLVQARRVNNNTIVQDNRGLLLTANIRL